MAKQNKPENAETEGFVVVKPFRAKNNFDKEYLPGDDANHFDEEELESLVGRGLVELANSASAPASE